mmetsp:Transcript_21379/g.63777  ORF Transcript_21379/g.63777 Transcript_21379/m.63777 type:complete len:274 (+) Transcript_21379:805-1626(+)
MLTILWPKLMPPDPHEQQSSLVRSKGLTEPATTRVAYLSNLLALRMPNENWIVVTTRSTARNMPVRPIWSKTEPMRSRMSHPGTTQAMANSLLRSSSPSPSSHCLTCPYMRASHMRSSAAISPSTCRRSQWFSSVQTLKVHSEGLLAAKAALKQSRYRLTSLSSGMSVSSSRSAARSVKTHSVRTAHRSSAQLNNAAMPGTRYSRVGSPSLQLLHTAPMTAVTGTVAHRMRPPHHRCLDTVFRVSPNASSKACARSSRRSCNSASSSSCPRGA